MLYLEDYLEMIENLPMEMREKLTEMREMDLEVQNALDSLEERVKTFFGKCLQPNVKPEWKEEQFQKIKQENAYKSPKEDVYSIDLKPLQDYYKAKSDADEKVQLANHIHDLVDRHLRKLDQELSKFKMELEADNAGITEILEKRSLELDKPQPQVNNQHKAEKRRIPQTVGTNHVPEKRPTTEVLSKLATEAAKEVIRRSDSAANSPSVSMFNSASSSPISYNLGHIGAGSNAAIAAAASQAIAATQQMQQGRRTSSMKASYDLMGRSQVVTKDVSLSLPAPTSNPTTPDSTPRSSRTKKPTTKAAAAAALASQHVAQPVQQVPALPIQPPVPQVATPVVAVPEPIEEYNNEVQVDDWGSDPNEPRYCLCNQVSYGDMVGCDNDDCPIEWFHYGCVGLSQAPKGKWYCPQCTAAMKRRGRR